MTDQVSALRALELRTAVDWFDGERLSASSVENFRRMVLDVADRLAPSNVVPLHVSGGVSDQQFSVLVAEHETETMQ